jgi:hypothetical protein
VLQDLILTSFRIYNLKKLSRPHMEMVNLFNFHHNSNFK